ncbi:MAG: hypothetical protein ACPHO8_15050, partial [Mariniblastus sp.]
EVFQRLMGEGHMIERNKCTESCRLWFTESARVGKGSRLTHLFRSFYPPRCELLASPSNLSLSVDRKSGTVLLICSKDAG